MCGIFLRGEPWGQAGAGVSAVLGMPWAFSAEGEFCGSVQEEGRLPLGKKGVRPRPGASLVWLVFEGLIRGETQSAGSQL